MEDTLVLKAEVRQEVGSKSAAKIRQQGQIPAIVYGHKQKPVAVCLDRHDFVEGLHHGHRLMDVQIGRKKEKMIVKDVQYDHLGKNIIHADLMRVNVTETITMMVPVELKGTAKGTHEGGIIEEHASSLEIECKVSDIPDRIAVSVKEIGIGDSIHAGDVELPTGTKLVSDSSLILVTCSMVAAAKTTEQIEEEVPAAPEVIGEAEKKEGQVASDEKTE